MAQTRSVEFLPEIFQTDVNRQFLAATLDQLVQEPRFKKTQGFIGRTVGPGINPNDKYVVEPTKTRADYQLEPGVISLVPDTNTIKNAITYPGINDAITYQGGDGSRPDRLYESEFYSWDPFVNFDSFINFSQYFWLPNGPDVVEINSVNVPSTATYEVTRENGVYQFSNVSGSNPTITLMRGGSYNFQVAQNKKETVNYRVTNTSTNSYDLDGISNPEITLARGNTYVFNLNLNGVFPFWIKTTPGTGTGDQYNDGVSRNGATIGTVTFTVPQTAPSVLYYASQNQSAMGGKINIVDGTPGTGPGFWIQTNPGVSGAIPTTPNISSRDVFGVTNNGEDLGTVTFNVPLKTDQQFFFNLTEFGTVDLLTDLTFDQINGQRVDLFIAEQGGIDGNTTLLNRTLVFVNPNGTPVIEGWERKSRFDPLTPSSTNNGLVGSYDTTSFDETNPVDPADWYSVWQINFVTSDGYNYINLVKFADLPVLNKFRINSGTQWSNTSWYKDAAGIIKQVPLLTSTQDILYYQDGTDPEIVGRIKLIDQVQQDTLFIDDILGKKNYTTSSGVVFTNGLKVQFNGSVEPASYASAPVNFTCTQTDSETNLITTSSTAILEPNQEVFFYSPTLGGLSSSTPYYVKSIVNEYQFSVSAEANGDTVTLSDGTGTMRAYINIVRQYYVSGVGTAIELLPVKNFITPESYVVDATTATIAAEPAELDYLTISRASKDLNAWTRSNRWFHIDVINATAQYNGTEVVLDNNYRAKRPIIEFRPGIRLFNMGTEGKSQPVDVIDFAETDAFSNIEGQTSYTINGYTLQNGSRIIFAADEDPDVRNKIYQVEFIIPDTIPPLIAQPVINLTLADDGVALVNDAVICLSGTNTAGKTFWFDGIDWVEAQQKTSIQQAPLFDVYDSTGVSFGNRTKYPSSTFVGSKLFSYAVGDTNILDPILKFPLQYLNINNVGDIVFENNLYNDTFLYVKNNISTTSDISSGTPREYTTRTVYNRLLGWQTAVSRTQQYQQFKFRYTSNTLKLDVKVNSQTNIPVLKIYVGSVWQDPSTYTYTISDNGTTITLLGVYTIDDIIEVLALSDQTSQVGFYQVPLNLSNNPLNGNSKSFTLGTIRTHYETICENLISLDGRVNGPNNTRDLGNLVPYGQLIVQQSAPLTMAGYFMRSNEYNIFGAIEYNSREYTKFKNQMLEAVTRIDIQFQDTASVLDEAISEVILGRVESQPFYWSDMIPTGAVYKENSYTVGITTLSTFDTLQVYDYKTANFLGMNVYLNGNILTRGLEYVVATDGPRVTVLVDLSVGDVVTIREYSATYGNFVPNTPTKLGLYPSYRPRITVQKTTSGTQSVIIGHDGSVTKTFGDLRDAVLLEFETRIFNNLKLDDNPVPLTAEEIIPGQFRATGYSFSEINNILAESFLTYVAWNKLDYRSQYYVANNEFSWNYSSSQNKLNNENLLGAWRGIYRYFYDTQQPEETPWEMLGFTIKPDWWDLEYGVGPYTGDNLVLWDDLEAGIVRDPAGAYIKPNFVRSGLTKVIPTGVEGELLSPFASVVGSYDATTFRKSWQIGDGSPVEASWWNSSNYPFAVMRLLAITKPAKFFALFADRDLYRYQSEFGQYLYNDRYRLDANGVQVYGNGVSKASYIDWIVDYNRQSGIDSTAALQADLANLDVRLCYRMASFSDKQYIKIYTEKSSPNSTNTTFLIPDESYDLLLYKNQPFDSASYSSVVIQQVPGGYAVYGYSTTQPYFNILTSQTSGRLQTLSAGGVTVRVPSLYTNVITQVPYGFIFNNITSVVDFLLSYGKFLESQGLVFDNTSNGYVLDWHQMSNEFLYWSQQGWTDNALINLNPLAFRLTVTKEQAIVDDIVVQTNENILLDQNRRELPTRNLNIVRNGNTFTVEPLSDQTLSHIDLRYTSYEHMIVLNNASVFGDLIYEPITGARQNRLNLIAVTSTDWTGRVDAPGFILNRNNIEEWNGLRTYAKGEIVKYKNVYWSAATIVQPSERFNANDWYQSDYEQIELGLLPNLSNKADQLANSYNINSANLERDNDLLSYGLIGFRPRQYMAALNLDDVSQVNVYRQFLGSKGTIQSVELLSNANLGKELADYQVYENWAVQRAVYGANANRSFFELRLNRALLSANPSLVQVVQPQTESQADQAILLSDVWRQSYKLTSPNILPTTITPPTDIALPTAGYVNIEDVDVTVFDINNLENIEANFSKLNVGGTIWVAKINDYDWGVYRTQPVPGNIQHVCDNLDGTSIVIFSKQHGLSVGDKLIIRFLDADVDGVYTVLTVPTLDKVTIAYQFTRGRSVINGQGVGFTLQTMRVAQASDINDLPYVKEIAPGARVWVDNNGQGLWQVLEKQDVFTSSNQYSPVILDANELYASSVTQSRNRFAALVGSPNYGYGAGTATGAVYLYTKGFNDQYTTPTSSGDSLLTLGVTGTRGYGNAVKFGNRYWAIAGASASLGSSGQANNGYACIIGPNQTQTGLAEIPYMQWQLLTNPDNVSTSQGKFGYSVEMSLDERWAFVGAPSDNKVYVYGQVNWQDQSIRTFGNNITVAYNIGNDIQVNAATQLLVTVDGAVQVLGVDYTVNGSFTTVTFTNPPAAGTPVEISRINTYQLDFQTYTGVTQTSTSGSGVNAEFTIIRTHGSVQVYLTSAGSGYAVSDTITIAASSFGGSGVTPIVLTVTGASGGAITSFSTSYTAPSLVSVFSLNEYFFTVNTIDSFTVTVNNIIQRPNIDYTFNATTKDLTFINVPVAGANIVVSAKTYYQYVTSLTAPDAASGDQFGYSIATGTDARQVIIGSRNSTVGSLNEAGAAYVFDRNVQQFVYQGTSNTFTVLGSVTSPVSVLVNGEFLINETTGIIGANGTFSQSGNSITINSTLQYGDIIQIETNQFDFVQKIAQNTVEEFSNFGSSVEFCSNNCSLYIGAPQSSFQIYKGGVVERSVNQSKVYGIITSTVANPTLTVGDTLRVNNVDFAVPSSNPTIQGLADAINGNISGILAAPNATASVANGFLTISVLNTDAALPTDKLQVAPGSVGSAFSDLGFKTFAHTQVIVSPYPISGAGFGQSLSLDDSAVNLVVSAPNGTEYLVTIFDDGTTDFDANSTTFFSVISQSGAIYTYDYLPSATLSLSNPGQFVFGSQVSNSSLVTGDQFGIAIDYTSGSLMIGAPGQDLEDSSLANYGRMFVYTNETLRPAWTVVYEQQPTVDVYLLNSVFAYDKVTSATTEFFDFINPLQGKILGAARQNIDYIGAVDPANYNVGPLNITGDTWGANRVGQIWWDLSTVRFIDPNQDSIVYAARRWSQVFPGSSVDVYQWIVSDTPPASYAGPGVPHSTVSYTINTVLTKDGTFQTQYYFWVKGLTTIASSKGKTLSISSISNYIENPKSSGIPYIAPINASTVAIYNAADIIEAQDTILHIEFDREYTNNNVHVEYELVAQDRADAWISDTLYRKLQDSFCGVDTFGNLVPDPNLSVAERYGVQFRPRQSMFTDRYEALRNYLTRANSVLALYPITETRSFNLLNSSEPKPSSNSGAWNKQVANLEILGFQDIYAVPLGYKYLVDTDSSNRGLWTIYEVQNNQALLGERTLVLNRVQNYNTPDYWSYINWYLPGYNSSINPIAEVPNYSTLETLNVVVGSSVKVTANAQGKWEIYQRTDTGWTRVGLQDGTIEFAQELWDYAIGRFGFDVEVFDAQYFDQEPVIETRKIIQAINEELFVDDLLIERNRLLTLMFNYVLSEFSAPEWLVKTSLVDVDHKIRELVPYQNYRRDNQEFVLDYIQEVKPYHVQVREFNLTYDGLDAFGGDITDFDVPAFYDTSLEIPQYVSPILLPYAHSDYQFYNTLSDAPANSTVWANWPYSQWFGNYLLTLDSISIVDNGSGYTEAPTVIITGDAIVPATAIAEINSLGQVVSITVTNPGSGYRATPVVTFDGGNGSSARAYPVLSNQMVRSFKTVIKFDRNQYTSSVLTWSPDGTYENGTLVRYDNRVWEADNQDGSSANVGPTFNLEDWTLVPASELSGIDRTMGYYVPGINEPGLELPLLVDGVDYPGVQVWGDYFTGTEILDTDYRSSFTDQYLGTRFTDIDVDGGQFLGPYEAHAPEELVNGAEYDTLDMKIYTRPGSDWQFDGHGFQIVTQRYTYDSATTEYSWANLAERPVELLVSNATTGRDLAVGINYTVDWVAQTIEITSGCNSGDVFQINVYEIGGGYQLFRGNYTGPEIDSTVVIPVNSDEITSIAVFYDGVIQPSPTWEPYTNSTNWNILQSYSKLDVVLNLGTYYRALRDVPVGTNITNATYWVSFVPAQQSLVTFDSAPVDTDRIALIAFGTVTIPAGYFVPGRTYTVTFQGNTDWSSVGAGAGEVGTVFVATSTGDAATTGKASTEYSWSTPQTQVVVVDSTILANQYFTVTNSMQGSNPVNMIVTRNGLRLRPPEAIEHIGDGSTVSFGLPQRGGYQQNIINAPTDIQVYIDDVLQVQSVGSITGSYYVTNWSGSNTPGRQVVFTTAPFDGARVVVTVNTLAEYELAGTTLQITPVLNLGDVVEVTSWNDTSQQNLLTLVFVGPVTNSTVVTEPYDTTLFDQGPTATEPLLTVGPFDYSSGVSLYVNDFDLGRTGVSANRLWVTLDGYHLFEGIDYTIQGRYLILASGVINTNQILVVTEMTDSVVPEAVAFRVFQDMRGVQATYRISASSTTTLVQSLSQTADIAYVADASKLNEPNLEAGVFGVVTIDGERIMYRQRDVVANTISGLRRGTAGTGAASHSVGTDVIDIGRNNLLYSQYQDYIVKDTGMGDGTTTVFYAPNISDTSLNDSTGYLEEAIEVYVGGIRQDYWGNPNATSEYRYVVGQFDPVAIEFITNNDPVNPLNAPAAGSEITILVRCGTWWYDINNEVERNQALQENPGLAARFLTGRN